jgi:beta-lactamase regulating signal transducer with metallopeptidase domain
MESYWIKSSLSLIVLYALYRIMLRYEFNHQLNRFIGLTCILFSICVPFVEFKDVAKAGQLSDMFYVVTSGAAGFQETVSSALPENTTDIFLLLYLVGASVCLLRCIVGLATLLRLYVNSPKSRRWGFTVVGLNRHRSPFTFFNVLFMDIDHPEDSDMETMLLHEQVHRDQYHSIDTVWLEALTVVFWFNPIMWLFKRDIKAEHEYYADERVLEHGISPMEYQLMLFKARTGTSLELGNHLSNKISLIKRFNMMTKARSKSKASYGRVSLFLALMSVIVFFTAFSNRRGDPQNDTPATYEQGEAAMYKTLTERIKYPSTARTENRSGLVYVSFTVNENGHVEKIKAGSRADGHVLKQMLVVGYSQSSQDAKDIDDALKTASVQAIEGLGKFTPAQKNGKPVSSVLTLPIQFKLE